ncbi:WD repeat-containing protein 6 [Exophiala dermatitidis]|uniref:Uncharacterized protein n=2 Tax=Exophiala dermatitidis TaxID=5970 RepID=H6BNJ6_EXODN|nr:uncharacterized protein HMPREF1120_00587 [Exophiala dermatitidis NIH/UT8656]KAJ4504809.1 WD repeat-containing protein 6 [Exophiala dermatitidis]EHY52373.1 hypothetical protein HMPREF1120_00587 [Exophiala dermatitidis NIH/UT8656]KAJ4506400.1 WD repeat-containing protein 6 [Exophiala dermatitidis]KAJ4506981.1 WD repeat-containing protein 6 [Exophiala dermatitidis]KAJ4547985.1 WD repeat-containing protein 6 [Exophiala dermatitidis]
MPDSPPDGWLLRSEGACLPITALQCVQVKGQLLVISGQGPHLHIYDQYGRCALSRHVFDVQPIHGIQAALDPAVLSGTNAVPLVLWGGSVVKFGQLTVVDDEDSIGNLRVNFVILRELTSPDWILDAALLPSGTFLLTAHNVLLQINAPVEFKGHASYTETTAVIKGPGSFLYSGDLCVASPNLIIVGSGTVFGEILVWTCSRESESHQWTTSVRHVFHGHRGSVFGVAVSERLTLNGSSTRLLASCSDDRTIRLWDISDCDEPAHDNSSNVPLLETGFGTASQTEDCQLASAWGHQSRVWGLEFMPGQTYGDSSRVLLSSQGEDAVYKLWSYSPSSTPIATEQDGDVLQSIYQDRHHSGKNIWSMSQLKLGERLIVCTGGADGQVVLRRLPIHDGLIMSPALLSRSFKEVTGSAQGLKQYLLLNQSDCLATTDSGDLYQLSTHAGELKHHRIYESATKGSLVVCHADVPGITFFAQQRGPLLVWRTGANAAIQTPFVEQSGISWMQVASQPPADTQLGMICLVAMLTDGREVVLWLTPSEASFQVKKTMLDVPSTFTITACCYDSATKTLILGSRAGALALYGSFSSSSETSGEALCVRHVHGTDSVTSVAILDTVQNGHSVTMHILTTGRDGKYTIQRAIWPQPPTGSMYPTIHAVHISSPPFGPYIEGAYFTLPACSTPTNTPNLILYGFRSTSFVVWNETQQSMLLSVECGGAHRSWSYKDSSVASSEGSHPGELDVCTRSFVWTKAGKVNWHRSQGQNHTILQKGGHGREIKAVARCPASLYNTTIVATGAEDTTIQLFAVEDSMKNNDQKNCSYGAFNRVSTLQGHTTGLQHLLFSSSGDFLFSSAGCEEFYVWRLTPDIPCIGIGVVLWDIMPKRDEDSDARIMSFDLIQNSSTIPENGASQPTTDPAGLTAAKEQSCDSYTLALAYSNGKTKIVRYQPASTRQQGIFEAQREIIYGSFCVLQAFLLPTVPLVEDGPSAQWDVLSAGTNGYINLSTGTVGLQSHTSEKMKDETAMQVHRTHQSSALAMDVVQLGEAVFLIASAGDDNGLGVTLLDSVSSSTGTPVPASSTTASRPRLRTIFVPRAHAAAVTALKVMLLPRTSSSSRISAAVVTAGNDQRVKVWIVHIDIPSSTSSNNNDIMPNIRGLKLDDDPTLNFMQLQRAASAWTSVADVSGVEIIPKEADRSSALSTMSHTDDSGSTGTDGRCIVPEVDASDTDTAKDSPRPLFNCKVLVVGVGMELLNLQWDQ